MKGKIFNNQEVQSILNGTKTMFREVIKPYPILSDDKSYWEFKGVQWAGENSFYAKNHGDNARPEIPDLCPYQVGQKIFVKEKWGIGGRPDQFGGYKGFEYQADCFGDDEDLPCYPIDYDKLPINIEIDDWIGKWEQARLMPQWASRITLEITSIKVERLKDINKEDCLKEGIEKMWLQENEDFPRYEIGKHSYFDPKKTFEDFWNATHKKQEEKWEANPFVWVVDFKINK